MSKVLFKEFVKKNTHLINYVESGTTSWQKLYELYDLYGENSTIWEKYKIKNNSENRAKKENTTGTNNQNVNFSNNFKDLLNMVKGVDLNTVQKGLNSLDKAIEAFKGILPDKAGASVKDVYEPRPTYKYFED